MMYKKRERERMKYNYEGAFYKFIGFGIVPKWNYHIYILFPASADVYLFWNYTYHHY